jgi:hypothetical protein
MATLAPGHSETVDVTGTFATGSHCNTATASGTVNGTTVMDTDSACYFGSLPPCEVTAYQEVCVEADIAIDPTVTVGTVTVTCVRPPAIRPFGTISCTPAEGPCGFTVQADVCVAVPVSFAAAAEPVATRSQCTPASGTSCLPDAPSASTLA